MNENLHLAIFRKRGRDGIMQRQIATQAGINEMKLCNIVYGRVQATPEERTALSAPTVINSNGGYEIKLRIYVIFLKEIRYSIYHANL